MVILMKTKDNWLFRGVVIIALCIAYCGFAQNCFSDEPENQGATWRDAGESDDGGASVPLRANPGENVASASNSTTAVVTDSGGFQGPKTTRYSLELAKLPNSEDQFWVVYDIAPYTERFPNLTSPQDSIVDWILFDSGDDFWRREPFSVLNASRDRLYVYHSDKVQRYVSNIVDRFIDPSKRSSSFRIQVVAFHSPDWRARVSQYLSPLKTTTVGNGLDVQSWLVDRSNFEKTMSELERRSDYTLINSVKNIVPNGEAFGWAAASPRKEYNRDYRIDSNSVAGYSTDTASVDEGFRIETTPLLSTTGETLEIMFRYRSTVVDRTKTFGLRVPTPAAPRQQLNVEKPMIISCDFRGKVAFERSHCAIIDLGMTPFTLPKKNGASETGLVETMSNLVAPKTVFYDVLLIISQTD